MEEELGMHVHMPFDGGDYLHYRFVTTDYAISNRFLQHVRHDV